MLRWWTPEVMRLPFPLHRAAVGALLVWCPVVVAQPPVARVRREQQLVLAERPAGGELELRVAPGVPTMVRLDADVERAELKGEGLGRIVRMDVAVRSLVLEPLRELAPGERLPLEVLLVQGSVRVRLLLLLVAHPTEVDTRVDVELRPRSARTGLEPEPPGPRREDDPFSRFVLSEELGKSGVTVTLFEGIAVGTGVLVTKTRSFQTGRRRILAFEVFNPVGARPWLVSDVVRLSPTGRVLGGAERWTVDMLAPIEPGGRGRVVVAVPEEESGVPVRVEVREKGGGRSVRLEDRAE